MAGGVAKPQPKVRSRKDGAAIPLDETDKRLMNLLQSSFPLAAEPYARARAPRPTSTLDDADDAHRRGCVRERIIREITPIFDTRALGYESMLVAAKVDAEHPHRAAKIINSHPGRLAQLPAHARVQPLVHDRDPARLRARPRRARSTSCSGSPAPSRSASCRR